MKLSGWGKLAPPSSPQFITYDLEFIDDGNTIDLVSIGMVSGDGRELYAVSREFDSRNLLKNKWMRENVWPHLPIDRTGLKPGNPRVLNDHEWMPKDGTHCRCDKVDEMYVCRHWNGGLDRDDPDVRTRGQIKRMVEKFIMASHPKDVDVDRDNVQLWAWYGAYDHVTLAQLWGPMISLPSHIPMHTNDLKTEVLRLGGISIPPQRSGNHNALEDARYNMARAKAIYATYQEMG
jgi:hypothetical protein